MKLKAGDSGDVVQSRSLLMQKLGAALPRELWKSLWELQKAEYSRGVRETVKAIQNLRKEREGHRYNLGDLMSGRRPEIGKSWMSDGSWISYERSFENELVRVGRIPKGKPGRPRLDQQGDEILRLKTAGKSWGYIARKVGKTADACRKHLNRRLDAMEQEVLQMKAELERIKKESAG